jgi:hypothetical protein
VETGWCWWKDIVANVAQKIPVSTTLTNNELPLYLQCEISVIEYNALYILATWVNSEAGKLVPLLLFFFLQLLF